MIDRHSGLIWWRHVRGPLVAFSVLAALLASGSIDIGIAERFFYDGEHARWLGAQRWWSNELLHTGGRWAVRALVAGALALCVASYFDPVLRPLRRASAYFAVSVVLSVAFIGLMKVTTSVDCPWDLAQFGGTSPFVTWFARRVDGMVQGHCFPAAHAGSGYALMSLYFAFRERSRRIARAGLGVGMLCGLTFGLAQQARGAHFVSHDVWSAFLAWAVAASLYAFVFRARLWSSSARRSADEELVEGVMAGEGWSPAREYARVHGVPRGGARTTRQ